MSTVNVSTDIATRSPEAGTVELKLEAGRV